jgi:hypothetical protein
METKQQKSVAWFIGKVRTPSGYRTKLLSNDEQSRDGTVLGKLYFFVYDPKHKKTLPIYDKFPLVFPIERYADGFLGVNLHYLSVPERQVMLKKLLELRTNNKLSSTTKLRLTYDILNSSRRLSGLRPCIKRYLFSHVRSRFVEISADEWDQAINLPVENFVRNS